MRLGRRLQTGLDYDEFVVW